MLSATTNSLFKKNLSTQLLRSLSYRSFSNTMARLSEPSDEAQAGFGTRAVHVGSSIDAVTGAVISPISLSTTFAQTAPAKPIGIYEYSRSANPNRDNFEQAVASLENGKYGLAFSSGSSAIGTVVHTLTVGDEIISIGDVYGGTHRYFTKVAKNHGIGVTFTNDIENNLKEILNEKVKLVWIETPSNPTLSLTDIGKVSQLINEYKVSNNIQHDIKLVVDNTFLSPYIQNPLDHGADIVIHSVTKYLNGHSDVVMGVLVTNNEKYYERLQFFQNATGAVPSAFDSWLAHRGLKTLHLRVERSSANALSIANFLSSHKLVKSVNYPGLKSNLQYDVVAKQHKKQLGGGMISFRIQGGLEAAQKFVSATKYFTLAESLGGIESLLEIPASMTHAGISVEERELSGVYDDLIRLSVGIEDELDLINDLSQALEASQ